MTMAPPKHRPRENLEDISVLRKPITIHGRPVEQILNSIHYGSPELRHLLLEECDMIFECKVCRALFRDLPNFIAHKRRYCLQLFADLNHHRLAAVPDERVLVVHPKPVNKAVDKSCKKVNSHPQENGELREVKELRSRSKDGSKSDIDDKEFYKQAEEKLRLQKEHAKITRVKTTAIPTNSNAVFIEVQSISSNFHDRHAPVPSTDLKTTNASTKSTADRKGTEKVKFTDKSKHRERSIMRSRAVAKIRENSEGLNNALMNELKAIQSKMRNKSHELKTDKVGKQQWAVSGRELNSVSNGADQSQIGALECKETIVSFGECPDSPISESSLQEKTKLNCKATSTKDEGRGNDSDHESISSKATSVSDTGLESRREKRGKSKRSLICCKCESIFSSLKSLQFHMKTSHTVKRMFFPCPCCANVYNYYQTVTRHLRINHNKNQKQINALKLEIKSKAFSRPLAVQDSSKIARRVLGSRQSARARDNGAMKRSGKDTYVYSSVNRSKKTLAKMDPALTKQTNEATNNSSIQKSQNICRRLKEEILDESFESKGMSSKLKTLLEKSSSQKLNSESKLDHVITQLHRCVKCFQLFGRKLTYDNHIKVCQKKNYSDSITSQANKLCRVETENDEHVPSNSSQSNIKITSSCLPLPPEIKSDSYSTGTSPILALLPKNDVVDGGDCRSDVVLSNHIIATDNDNCNKSSTCPTVAESRSKSSRKSATPVKFNVSKQSPVLIPKTGDNPVSDCKTDFDSTQGESTCDDSESTKSSEASFSVTRVRTKSKTNSLHKQEGNEMENSDQSDKEIAVGFSNDYANVEEKAHEETNFTDTEKSQNIPEPAIVERPRRKRKVPSRNVDAAEFLQKIHRGENGEASTEKKVKKNIDDDSDTSSLQNNDVSTSQQCNRRTGAKGSGGLAAPRTRVNANKIFVLNRRGSVKKLECLNSSKVEKLIDFRKKMCLKCGAKFSFLHNLKRHVVRLHLNWSRFQCKLCNFNSFDKSECNTHIIRKHKDETKFRRNNIFFNTLIIDLAKQGSEEMSMKKLQTLKAKKIQEKSDENIYKNQNATKVPRLHQRLQESVNSNDNNGLKKQLSAQAEADEKTSPALTKPIRNNSPSFPKVIPGKRIIENRNTQVSHLVKRSSPISTSPVSQRNRNRINSDTNPENKNSTTVVDNANPDLSGNFLQTSKSSVITGTNPAIPAQNAVSKRSQHPFNISTRNSPRIFDTAPYPREPTDSKNDSDKVRSNTDNLKRDCLDTSLISTSSAEDKPSRNESSVKLSQKLLTDFAGSVVERKHTSPAKVKVDNENGNVTPVVDNKS